MLYRLISIIILIPTIGYSYKTEQQLLELVSSHRQSIQNKSSAIDNEIARISSQILESLSPDENLKNLHRASLNFYSNKYLEAKLALKNIDEDSLSVDHFKKMVELEFKIDLKQKNIKGIKKQLLSRSSRQKYRTFLESKNVFDQLKNLLSESDRKSFNKFVFKTLAKFPFSESSVSAFNYINSCDLKERSPIVWPNNWHWLVP